MLWRSFRIGFSSARLRSGFCFHSGRATVFHDKNFRNEPKRCKACKSKRQEGLVRSRQGPRGTVETLAVCSQCGRETTVPFRPTQGRPVFCRECFQGRKPRAPPAEPKRSGNPVHLSPVVCRPPKSLQPVGLYLDYVCSPPQSLSPTLVPPTESLPAEVRHGNRRTSLERLRLKLRYKVLYHMGHNCADVDDLVQETLTRFIRAGQRHQIRNTEEFGAFLNGVCRNVILEYRRRVRREPAAIPMPRSPNGASAPKPKSSSCATPSTTGWPSFPIGTAHPPCPLSRRQRQRRYLPRVAHDRRPVPGGPVPGKRAFSPGLSAN